MNDRYILSFDTGLSSGIALGKYSETEPYSLVKAYQFTEGVAGLCNWLSDHFEGHRQDVPGHFWINDGEGGWHGSFVTTIISEKFTPINHANYALTTASVEPLRCEGALVALGVMPDIPHKTWRRPSEMYIFGGDTLPEKKKRAYAWLKANGMYVTGKTVGQPNADDARSAIMHGISYLVKVEKHEPTWRLLTGTVE